MSDASPNNSAILSAHSGGSKAGTAAIAALQSNHSHLQKKHGSHARASLVK
jgi:hypothetical protein